MRRTHAHTSTHWPRSSHCTPLDPRPARLTAAISPFFSPCPANNASVPLQVATATCHAGRLPVARLLLPRPTDRPTSRPVSRRVKPACFLSAAVSRSGSLSRPGFRLPTLAPSVGRRALFSFAERGSHSSSSRAPPKNRYCSEEFNHNALSRERRVSPPPECAPLMTVAILLLSRMNSHHI